MRENVKETDDPIGLEVNLRALEMEAWLQRDMEDWGMNHDTHYISLKTVFNHQTNSIVHSL